MPRPLKSRAGSPLSAERAALGRLQAVARSDESRPSPWRLKVLILAQLLEALLLEDQQHIESQCLEVGAVRSA